MEPATELEDGEAWYTTEDELIDSQTGSTSTRKTLETLEIPQTPKTKIKNSSGSNTEDVSINYDNITVNKYFYNQLNKYSQIELLNFFVYPLLRCDLLKTAPYLFV